MLPYNTGIVGAVTSELRIEIGTDIFLAGKTSGIVPCAVRPMGQDGMVPVQVPTIVLGIPVPAVVENVCCVV